MQAKPGWKLVNHKCVKKKPGVCKCGRPVANWKKLGTGTGWLIRIGQVGFKLVSSTGCLRSPFVTVFEFVVGKKFRTCGAMKVGQCWYAFPPQEMRRPKQLRQLFWSSHFFQFSCLHHFPMQPSEQWILVTCSKSLASSLPGDEAFFYSNSMSND